MTIKLFCKQIEVVDYESFIIPINTIALVYLLILYLEFFKLRKYYTGNYIIYTLYLILLYLY